MIGAILFGLTLPLSPVQILWVNLLTAGALGLTLAFEPTRARHHAPPAAPARRSPSSPACCSGGSSWSRSSRPPASSACSWRARARPAARGRPDHRRQRAGGDRDLLPVQRPLRARHLVDLDGVLGTPAVLVGRRLSSWPSSPSPICRHACHLRHPAVALLDGAAILGVAAMFLLVARRKNRYGAAAAWGLGQRRRARLRPA